MDPEKYEIRKKGGFFNKMKISGKKDHIDKLILNEGLFIIAEEPSTFTERNSNYSRRGSLTS